MPVEGNPDTNALLRELPQVEAVLSSPELLKAAMTWRRDLLKRQVQTEIAATRAALTKGGGNGSKPLEADADAVARRVAESLRQLQLSVLRPVVNATGVLLHTNLGRAVISRGAARAVQAAATAYSNLELDLDSGKRTRRDVTLEPLLQALTGCEAGTVVNNNAAAVFLVLHTLARRREVVTSRGELVEIGGSYRVPDIVRASGCKLVEVGTTNRTRVADYEEAITPSTALLLKTHPSNYTIRGFTEEAALTDLCQLGRCRGVPVFYDLGSGYIAPEHGTALPEPDVLSALAAGPALLSFSGDKLLGGPQAGIIIGDRTLIARLRKSPLWRMLRIDKFTAAALGATLLEKMRHVDEEPRDTAVIANFLKDSLTPLLSGWALEVVDAPGSYGGGSLPEETVPSHALVLASPDMTASELDRYMRDQGVVGYAIRGRYALNVLTLLANDADRVVHALTGLTVESETGLRTKTQDK